MNLDLSAGMGETQSGQAPRQRRPIFLFAPGAGAPSSHPWMLRWAGHLRELGEVRLLDYPYMLEKRGRPDPLPRLIAAHRAVLEAVRAKQAGPVILIGKSMGSRVGCHLSLEAKVAAVICLGYPLCGGGDPAKLRDKVLLEMTTPILFVQGMRDTLCPLDLLGSVRDQMKAPNELLVIEGGDHSLAVTKGQLKASGQTQAEVEAGIIKAIATFFESRC